MRHLGPALRHRHPGNGRAGLGPEANAPNTLNHSCADGTSGIYQSDESLESLKVFTSDGSDFAPGKTVTIQAKVWAYSGFGMDFLDLYYAANANNPTWTLIGTLQPPDGGLQTLTATYTLPGGNAPGHSRRLPLLRHRGRLRHGRQLR